MAYGLKEARQKGKKSAIEKGLEIANAAFFPKSEAQLKAEAERKIIQETGLNEYARGFTPEQRGEKTTKDNVDVTKVGQAPPPFEVVRDTDTGEITGYTDSQGNTFFTKPEEVAFQVGKDQQKTELPQGTQEMGTAQLQQQAAAQAANIGNINPELLDRIAMQGVDVRQAGLAGIRAGIPGILSNTAIGAGAGALGGAALGGGVGALPGALIGGAVGLAKGVYSAVTGNLEKQKRDIISNQKKVLTDGTRNLRGYIAAAKADPANAANYVDKYNQQLANIQQAYGQLHLQANNDLNLFLGQDGSTQLNAFASFYSPGGALELYNTNMARAVAGGTIDEATLLELETIYSELTNNG